MHVSVNKVQGNMFLGTHVTRQDKTLCTMEGVSRSFLSTDCVAGMAHEVFFFGTRLQH